MFVFRFYGQAIRASAILFGDISPPLQAQDLYDILESFTLQYEVEEGRSYSSAPVAKEPRKVCVSLLRAYLVPSCDIAVFFCTSNHLLFQLNEGKEIYLLPVVPLKKP